MRKKITKTYIIFLTLWVCLGAHAQHTYSISNISLSKDASKHIKPGEYIKISFDYTSAGNEIQIIAEPMYMGEIIKSAHTVPSAIIKDTLGKSSCSLTLTSDGDIDNIRFRAIETRTSLMLYEYMYKSDIEFSTKATTIEVAFEVEKYEEDKIFTYGIITNKSSKSLNKLILEIPVENAEIVKIAGINNRESENGIILYADLWRTPLKAGESKQFILEWVLSTGFTMPKTGKVNNTSVDFILTGDQLLPTTDIPVAVNVNVLSEWENGCIVEFDIEHDNPQHLSAEMGPQIINIDDHWGINSLSHKETVITFQGIDKQFGFIANKKGDEFIVPQKVKMNEKEVPVKTINRSSTKKNSTKPVVRNAVLAFDLKNDGHTKVSILDKKGTVVETLFEDDTKAGFHTFRWTPKNLDELVYFYKLETNGTTHTGQILY